MSNCISGVCDHKSSERNVSFALGLVGTIGQNEVWARLHTHPSILYHLEPSKYNDIEQMNACITNSSLHCIILNFNAVKLFNYMHNS